MPSARSERTAATCPRASPPACTRPRAACCPTRREDELLELLGKGLRNRELAQVLGISEDTVKTHLKSLFRKLDVSDRAEAVREAMRRGFLQSQ